MFALAARDDDSVRPDVKTIWLPSGDQTGVVSAAGSKVKRDLTPRAASITQISRFLASTASTATRLPSGESLGLSASESDTTCPAGFPLRSIHCNCVEPGGSPRSSRALR